MKNKPCESITPLYNYGSREVTNTLPKELSDWVSKNTAIVEKIRKALEVTKEELNEEALWEIVATHTSEQWAEARNNFNAAEAKWAELNTDNEVTLGSIGDALEWHIRTPVKDEFDASLAYFKITDEGLREREDLKNLMQVFKVINRLNQTSLDTTQSLRKTTAKLETLDLKTSKGFNAEAVRRHSPITRGLSAIQSYAVELLGPRKTSAKTRQPGFAKTF